MNLSFLATFDAPFYKTEFMSSKKMFRLPEK